MKNTINFFEAEKTMAIRVAEFFRIVLHKAELQTIYRAKIDACDVQIASYEDVLENGSKCISEAEAQEGIAKWVAQKDEYVQTLSELIEAEATFELSDSDKDFRKAMRKAESVADVQTAVRDWFMVYNLNVAGSKFEDAVMTAIGKKISVKKVVKSEGAKALVWDTTNALKNLYAVSFEAMVEAGTIKPAQIPQVLRDKYAKKQTKKSKKAAK